MPEPTKQSFPAITSIDDLAPCPFCGGEARWVPPSDDAFPSQGYVECYECDARTAGTWTADTARDLWNRRKGC
jgi:Lar family restriction alleviation protein